MRQHGIGRLGVGEVLKLRVTKVNVKHLHPTLVAYLTLLASTVGEQESFYRISADQHGL